MMAVFPWQSTVQDQDGNAIASAQLTIRENGPAGAVATIFSDSAETSLANPFNATSDGFAQFWAAAGTYYIEAESSGQTTDGWYVVLTDTAGGVPVVLTATVAAGEAVTADGALVTEATAAEYLGLAQAGGVATDTINVQSTGNYTLGTWAWTADEYVYLTNAGDLTQTPPTGTHRRIGIATAPTIIALSAGPVVVETGGAGSENAIPALSDAGLIDYTMIEKAATGGAGAENLLVQADADGEIDISFLGAVVDTSRQFTASGAITAGDAVSLSAADTVNAVGTTAGVFSFNEQLASTALGVSPTAADSAFNSTDGIICHAYIDDGNKDVTVSLGVATGTSVSYGTATVIAVGNYASVSVTYDAVNNVFILCYSGSTADTFVQAFSVTGTAVDTVGTAVSVRAQNSFITSVAAATTGAQFVAVYSAFNATVYARAGSISGTAITLGTELTVNGGDNNAAAVGYDPSTDKYVALIGDDTNNQIRSFVLSPTGVALAVGTAVNIQAATTPAALLTLVCSTGGQLFAITPEDTTTYKLAAGTVSGTTCTWSDTEHLFGTSNTGGFPVLGWNSIDDEFGIVAANTNAAGGSGYEFCRFTVAAGSIVNGPIEKLTGIPARTLNSSNSTRMAFDPSEGVYATLIKQGSPTMYEVVIDPAATSTNANEFVGFADATVADAETVAVSLLGNVNTDQTGLTFNTNYYIAKDGTLSTSDTGYGIIGRALSSTEILVTKNTWTA